LYCLEGYELVPQDMDGSNNPYLIISDGKNTINCRKTAKQTTSRPAFFECHELLCQFPAQTVVEIGIWDYDRLSSDDIIGMTKIDLEARYFSDEWRAMKLKPCEFRTLWNPSSSSPQGQLKLWVDILTPEEAERTPVEDISPPSPLDYELRVIVWETKDVPFKDKNMSDIFVTGYPEGQHPQVTDTHWRSENGIGLFNWRMKFPITVPNTNPRFKIQIWDKDYLSPDDAIAEANLNIRAFFNRAYKKKSKRESLPRQWLTLTHPTSKSSCGSVEVEFELLTLEESSRNPAGFGREEPDKLPEPKRPETSFNIANPFNIGKIASKLIWGQNKKKIMVVLGCTCCCIVVVVLLLLYIFVFRGLL